MTVGTDKKAESKPVKIYNNGKTYKQNVASGAFIHYKHLQNHSQVMTELNQLREMMANITEKLAK